MNDTYRDYYPHPLLDMRPEDHLPALVGSLRQHYPHLKIGEPAHPGATVYDGKHVEEYLTHDQVVRLDYAVPVVHRPFVRLESAKSLKVFFEDPHCFDIFKDVTCFVYPCSVTIPHAEWLKLYKPGDVVNLNDKNYYASPYTLTKEDFNNHSYAIFRYILSDH